MRIVQAIHIIISQQYKVMEKKIHYPCELLKLFIL